MPERIRLSRAKGWRKPEGAIVVSRPTQWGNPFQVGVSAPNRPEAVRLFQAHAIGVYPFTTENIRQQLGGKDLACWCPLDEACHVDVLLRIANSTPGGTE